MQDNAANRPKRYSSQRQRSLPETGAPAYSQPHAYYPQGILYFSTVIIYLLLLIVKTFKNYLSTLKYSTEFIKQKLILVNLFAET